MKHAQLNMSKSVPLNTPGGATTGATNSDWVGLRHGEGVVFRVVLTEGRAAAADDNTLTFRQATDAAGTGAKAFVPRRAYVRADGTSLADAAAATPTEIEAVNGAIDIHIDGDMTSVIDVEIDAAELDVNNDFAFLQARLAGVAGSTTTTTISAEVVGLRQVLSPLHQPNVLA